MQRHAIYQDGPRRGPEAARIVLIGLECRPTAASADLGDLSRRCQKIVRPKEAHRYLANQARFFFRCCEEDRFVRAISVARR
jgi:hypothetical protein